METKHKDNQRLMLLLTCFFYGLILSLAAYYYRETLQVQTTGINEEIKITLGQFALTWTVSSLLVISLLCVSRIKDPTKYSNKMLKIASARLKLPMIFLTFLVASPASLIVLMLSGVITSDSNTTSVSVLGILIYALVGTLIVFGIKSLYWFGLIVVLDDKISKDELDWDNRGSGYSHQLPKGVGNLPDLSDD